MSNNTVEVDPDSEPTPQERAELALEQEQVRQMLVNTIAELNTYLSHACKIGMVVDLREENFEAVGRPPQKVVSLVRAAAEVGFRRAKA